MKTVSIPARLWYDNAERILTFPERWEVDNLTSPGFEKPRLSSDMIREKIARPLAGPSLGELASRAEQAVIVIDDMTRPTPVKDIAPHILDILHQAGVKREQIRFIWALGSHGAADMIAARKKLGEEIVENYAVFNHDPFQNCVWVGRTPTGVELWFNREYMACDLKIGIGCITAHVHVGFGGGAKLIMPGMASIETINQFHNQLSRDPARAGLGNFENNIMRAECDAAGDMTGLNFKVDCLINRRGEISDLYAGPFKMTHAVGGEAAKEHYGIPFATGYDVAVCNAYGKANESAIALLLSLIVLKGGAAGVAVLICDASEGQIPHYVMRAWGSTYGGRHFVPRQRGFISLLFKKLIIMNPNPDRMFLDLICHADDAVVVKSWDEVVAILEKDYPEGARIAVIQDGTVQYIKKPAS
jgi:nickel-dependent lactate racemase